MEMTVCNCSVCIGNTFILSLQILPRSKEVSSKYNLFSRRIKINAMYFNKVTL